MLPCVLATWPDPRVLHMRRLLATPLTTVSEAGSPAAPPATLADADPVPGPVPAPHITPGPINPPPGASHALQQALAEPAVGSLPWQPQQGFSGGQAQPIMPPASNGAQGRVGGWHPLGFTPKARPSHKRCQSQVEFKALARQAQLPVRAARPGCSGAITLPLHVSPGMHAHMHGMNHLLGSA